MAEYKIIKLREHFQCKVAFTNWFHEKWEIPLEAYLESMDVCLKHSSAVPQWYGVIDEGRIIAGMGVIENDFHDRKDLTPNLCALYVDEPYRCRGIAGELLSFVCDDMNTQGIGRLYLLTDHTSFYERYGWKYLCMVQGDCEPNMTRMYTHQIC